VEAAVCDVESKLMQALLDDCGGAIRRDIVPKGSALHTVRTRTTPGGKTAYSAMRNDVRVLQAQCS
jgi:hypothetical protein